MTPLRIFISSVQKEFAAERTALRDFLRGDALMRRFFEPFLFEDLPADRLVVWNPGRLPPMLTIWRASRPESQPESRPESVADSLEGRLLTLLTTGPKSKAQIAVRPT